MDIFSLVAKPTTKANIYTITIPGSIDAGFKSDQPLYWLQQEVQIEVDEFGGVMLAIPLIQFDDWCPAFTYITMFDIAVDQLEFALKQAFPNLLLAIKHNSTDLYLDNDLVGMPISVKQIIEINGET